MYRCKFTVRKAESFILANYEIAVVSMLTDRRGFYAIGSNPDLVSVETLCFTEGRLGGPGSCR